MKVTKVIPVILIALVLLIATACGGGVAPATPTPTPTPTPMPSAPQVFEKYVEGLISTWDYRDYPEERERQTLRFHLVAGDRVEGTVSISKDGTSVSKSEIYGLVRDPYGNIILRSAYRITSEGWERSTQEFPWQFSFFGSTTGEFSLEVNTGGVQLMGPSRRAHLKVIVYDE